MADLSNAFWSETDASNNNASPNGWPEGMMPSGVNDAARADKGALKRFWDRINPVQAINPSGGVWTFVTSNISYPSAYVNGEIYSFVAAASSAAADYFRVNTLPLKAIWVIRNNAFDTIRAYDIIGNSRPILVYDSGLNSGAGAFLLVNPSSPLSPNGTLGSGTLAGSLTVNGALTANGITATGLTVNGPANINGNLQIPDNLSGTGALKIGSLGSYLGRQVTDGSTILQTAQGYLLLNPSGSNVGIGTVSPTSTLHVVGTGTITGAVTISAGGTALNLSGGSMHVAGSISVDGIVTTNLGASFGTGGAVTIAAGGTALDVSGGSAHVAGSINVGGDVNCQDITASVQGYKPGGGAWAAISDVRTKDADIADYTRGLDAVMRLHPVSYRYNGRAGMPRDGRTLVGLVADDVLPVMPEMVGMMKERLDPDDAETTDILTLDTTALTFALLNAVKTIAAENDALLNTVKTIAAEVAALKKG